MVYFTIYTLAFFSSTTASVILLSSINWHRMVRHVVEEKFVISFKIKDFVAKISQFRSKSALSYLGEELIVK